jgi:hypothetical protein
MIVLLTACVVNCSVSGDKTKEMVPKWEAFKKGQWKNLGKIKGQIQKTHVELKSAYNCLCRSDGRRALALSPWTNIMNPVAVAVNR